MQPADVIQGCNVRVGYMPDAMHACMYICVPNLITCTRPAALYVDCAGRCTCGQGRSGHGRQWSRQHPL